MRKILNIMAIALAIFCRIPVEVHGQSFLKKLKQKVGNVVGTKDDTAEIGAFRRWRWRSADTICHPHG